MTQKLIAASLCAGLLMPAAAQADQLTDLSALRAQMQQMQKDYAARMMALEKRLAKAEAEAAAARKTATVANTTAKTAAVSAAKSEAKLAAVPRPRRCRPLLPQPPCPHRPSRRPTWRWHPPSRRRRRPLLPRPPTIPSIPASPRC